MKKILSLVLTLTLVFSLAACANTETTENSAPASSSAPESTAAPEESTPASEGTVPAGSAQPEEETSRTETEARPETEAGSASLVVYFSWSGNTESVANEIQAQTGADLFEIVPAEPYTDDYDTLLDIAREEQANGAHPAIAETVENFEQYDTVYFGFPNWWGAMPMILYTFLDEYDFSGKTIAPFVTSGGSGFSGSIGTIESMEPEATVTEGLSLGSSQAAEPAAAVTEWLAANGLSD